MPRSSGQRLLGFDRRLGVRFVAGTDEAGRGSLAGPLVVAGVLLDYELLRGARVRPLASLNDSKQVSVEEREVLFEAVGACASAISVRIVPVGAIDREGLHRSNLAGMRAVLSDLHPPAEACLVDGFRLGPSAPPHRAIVDGDARSAAIAAASIVAKVVRDRVMRRLDALYPRYGFISHVGYITPAHNEAVRAFGPSELHRRSFQAACYRGEPGETGAVPVKCASHRDAASSVAPLRRAWALPASLPHGDWRNPTDEARSTSLSAA
jgi:ribonuclease HII